MLMQKNVFRVTLFLIILSSSFPIASGQTKSRVIVGASVIDGTGRRPFRASVRIEGDRITRVGLFTPKPGEEIINARGFILAPGFIDIHNHSEQGLDSDTAATTQVSQGITTLAVGPDGGSPWPVGDYLSRREQKRASVNVLAFVGHATVRYQVLGEDYNRRATEKEIRAMRELVERGMREGAFGLSTGLEYDVGRASATEEVIELARVAARYGGIYMTHMRDEEEGMFTAVAEAIRIGREAALPVQISHIKMGNRNVWGKSREVIQVINRAKRSGLDITADCYPYTAWASTISILVPSRRHDDAAAVRTALGNVGGADKVLITNCKAHPDYEGKTLEEIARDNGSTPVAVYQQIIKDGGAAVVCSSMSEADVEAFYRQPWVMVSSDGGIGSRHPRGAGTFPRVLGRFVRENRWLALTEAVRKMTSMPAIRLGLSDRGVIRAGMKADLVLFDAKKVIDRSTFKEPQLLSEGINQVIVNGETVWAAGQTTDARPGVVIRKNGAASGRN
jgi:N-acyl-D-amino-acid deacylase